MGLRDNMNKLMDQTNTFLLKIANLEAADTFLQESYTQLTERTIKLEKSSKKVDEQFTILKKTHEENIQPHLAKLDVEISEVKQENSNNSDMFENLTNKATDSLMSQINALKSDNKENIDILEKGLDEGFITLRDEVEEAGNKRNDKIHFSITQIEEENKKSSQQLFGIQEIVKAQIEEAKRKDEGEDL